MLSTFYRDQLPDVVVQDPIASVESLYVLASIMLFRQRYNPESIDEVREFILSLKKQLSWPERDFIRVMTEVDALLDAYSAELEEVVFIIPTQPQAKA